MTQGHIPVLLTETLEVMNLKAGGRYLDGTFGGGGHTQAILDAAKDTHVVCLDCDPAATMRVQALEALYPGRLTYHAMNFGSLATLGESDMDGMLFDLGLSSFQLDTAERGFSFRFEGPLDMRLNPTVGRSAAEFLETAAEAELVQAIRDYGEERQWRRIVEAIMRARGSGTLQTTLAFSKLIERTIGIRHYKSINPATQTFQGIRIAINGELDAIEQMLPAAFAKLKIGGILAIITFHSLEDRLVKRFFKKMAGMPEHRNDATPLQFREKWANLLTKKSIKPSEAEVAHNPRSRSAKLRALIKLKEVNAVC